MSYTKQIATIIENRRPLIKKIERVQQNLRSLSSSLFALENQRKQITSFAKPEFTGPLEVLDITAFESKITKQLEELEQLKRRVSRETLNIGVIGFARQGKSRLLRSISGLESTVIPDGNQGYCTGVRSTIYHKPNIQSQGEVWFYTDRAFIDEVIAPYYDLKELNLGSAPLTIDQFANKPLPLKPDNISGFANLGSKYAYLQKYKDEIKEYKPLFYTTSPQKISLDQVREYVAQIDTNGDPLYYHRAVREVKIFCDFPYNDVGQIALIDMPGLGDTGIGDQKRLLEALKEDIDVALFVRMPSSSGDEWETFDTDLYDLVRSALPDLPIERWSFMILNRKKKDDNLLNCQRMQGSIESKGSISVVECVIADCSDSAEVQEIILKEVLNYLVENIAQLDKQFSEARQAHLNSLQSEIQTVLESARDALKTSSLITDDARLEESIVFKKLFKDRWEAIAGALERLVRELRKRRSMQHPLFQEYVQSAFEKCDNDPMPSLKDIEAGRDSSGSYGTVYDKYLDEVRTRLTHNFSSLDDALKLSMEEVKGQVADVLVSEGYLGSLLITRTGTEIIRARDLLHDEVIGETMITEGGTEFLKELAVLIPKRLQALKEAFQTLADFNLSYRGFIQYRIRKHLDDLSPDTTTRKLSTNSSEEVFNYLKALHNKTVGKLEQDAVEWVSDANEVAFAIVEEFKDQTLRSKDAREEWEFFYEAFRSIIWPEEFKQLGEKFYLEKLWQESLDKALQANKIELFQFLR